MSQFRARHLIGDVDLAVVSACAIGDYPLYFLFPLIKGRVSEELLAPSPHHPRHVIALGSLPKLEELVVCSLSCVEIIRHVHIEVNVDILCFNPSYFS